MPSLFSAFYSRHLQTGLVSLCTILMINYSVRADQGAACNSSPVFAFSQALYWQDYPRATRLLSRVEHERGAVMAAFLLQVLNWKQGYDLQNNQRQIEALDGIDRLINQVEVSLQHTPLLEIELLAANIMLHSARINLVMGRVIRAARLAKRGNALITNVLRQNPNKADAWLAAGLYQYYTGDTQNGFTWVKRWFNLQGDKKRGRQLIERAMALSPAFAFEAARSLKMELDWNKQDVCRYPVLLPNTQFRSMQSLELIQLEITADLFCGRTQLANKRIQEAGSQLGSAQTETNRWFEDARLYALAQAGEVETLTAMLNATQGPDAAQAQLKIQFSLAKALDVQGEHDQSQPVYQALLDSALEDAFKNLAKKYLAEPYRAPITIEPEINLVACPDR